MSLPEFVSPTVPDLLEIDLEKLCPPTDRFRLFAERIYPLLVRARTVLEQDAYCLDNGRTGIEPVWLMGLTVLQYMERVPDRQAIELLRYHVGWNVALHRSLEEPTFHPTVLVYFRQRLEEHSLSGLVFQQILEGLVEAGLVSRRTPQRLDSTQMWGLVSRMSRLECMRESLRLALEELAGYAAMDRPQFWSALWSRYVESQLDYRAGAKVLRARMDEAGADAARLLQWLQGLQEPSYGSGAQVQLLQRVLAENFELSSPAAPVQRPAQPAGAVHNPHEPQAQWAAKGRGQHRREHIGYKIQVAETVWQAELEPGEPTRNFLTTVVTQSAIGSEEAGMELVEQEQAQAGVLEPPPAWYVDGGYVSAEKLAQAQGRELIGPAQGAPHWAGRYSSEDFEVCVPDRQAICPAGKTNTRCSRLAEEKTGKVSYRFEWSAHCRHCPLRERCLGPGQKHRSLVVGEHHPFLQARRREQKSEAFQKRARQRNAIEGTHSELRRAHGLNRARYRGLRKARLQNCFIGAACNAKRWIKRVIWEMDRAREGVRPALESG
jgi:transposase